MSNDGPQDRWLWDDLMPHLRMLMFEHITDDFFRRGFMDMARGLGQEAHGYDVLAGRAASTVEARDQLLADFYAGSLIDYNRLKQQVLSIHFILPQESRSPVGWRRLWLMARLSIALVGGMLLPRPAATQATSRRRLDAAIEQSAQRMRHLVLSNMDQECEYHLQVVEDALYEQTAAAKTVAEIQQVEYRLRANYFSATARQALNLPASIRPPRRTLIGVIGAAVVGALVILGVVANVLQVVLANLSGSLLMVIAVLLVAGAVVSIWRARS